MPNDDNSPRPVCFMVMPFGTKPVTGAGDGAPSSVDCNALWDKAYRPAIEAAGFTAIRADAETGAVIVKDMFERLAYANLVVADVSLPNGNVYYELGLRQVAEKTGCVAFAADWSKQLFDIDQFRTARYALETGVVTDVEAAAIQEVVKDFIGKMKDSMTPWHDLITGQANEQQRRGVFQQYAEQLNSFQAKVRAARLLGDAAGRKAKVEEIWTTLPPSALGIPDIATEMLILVRDELGWAKTLQFADELPPAIAQLPQIEEQRLFALAQQGKPEEAVAHLQQLIKVHGATPERLGLIGGRYKKMWRAARDERVAKGSATASFRESSVLQYAIDAYTQGMEIDYNQYYCSGNIAQLLLARNRDGDAQRAVVIDQLVVAACERAIKRDEDDGWARPTLLAAAFRARDLAKANDLAMRVSQDGIGVWKRKSAIADLKDAAAAAKEYPEGQQLAGIVSGLEELLKEREA